MEKEKKGFFDTRITSANVGLKEAIFGYILGPLFGLMSSGMLAGNMLKYWEALGLNASFTTALPLISIVFIVIGNLVVGQIIDKTKSRHGKARPYILISAVLISIASILFFAVPAGGDQALMCVWVAIAYNIYYAIAYPLYFTSNSSMIALSTRNGKHRGLLSSVSNLALTGAAAGGPIILNVLLDLFGAQPSTYLFSIIAIGALSFLFVGLQYFYTRERVTEENFKLGIEEKKIPTSQQLKAVFKDKYWWMVIAFYVVFQICGMVQNTSLVYYNDYIFAPEYGNGFTYSILQIVPGIVLGAGVIFSWPLANKIGKKNAICIGLVVSAIGCAIALFASLGKTPVAYSPNWWIQLIGIIVIRLGAGPANYVMLALFADVLDHNEAKHGFRSDGFSMSIFSIIMAVSTSLAQGIISLVINSTGYTTVGLLDANGKAVESVYRANQAAAGDAISWLFLGFMMVGYVICFAAIWMLKVEKHTEEDKKLILEHQKAEVLAAGKEWIEPEERLRLEQEQADKEAEEARIIESKAVCEKKGLNFEEVEAAYQAKLAAKKAKAEAKAALKK